jgi:hypothetical protein
MLLRKQIARQVFCFGTQSWSVETPHHKQLERGRDEHKPSRTDTTAMLSLTLKDREIAGEKRCETITGNIME